MLLMSRVATSIFDRGGDDDANVRAVCGVQ